MTVPIELPAPPAEPPGDLPFDNGWKVPILGNLWGLLFGGIAPPGYKAWHQNLINDLVHHHPGHGEITAGNRSIASAATLLHLEDLSRRLLWQVASYTMADLYDVSWHIRYKVIPAEAAARHTWDEYLWHHLQSSVRDLERIDAANLRYLWAHLVDTAHQLERTDARNLAYLWSHLQSSVHALERTDAANLAYLWSHLQSSVHALERADAADLAAARAYAAQLHRTVEQDLARDVRQLERYTDTRARQARDAAVDIVDAQVTRATAATWPVIVREASGLRHQLGRDFGGVAQLLQEVPGKLPATAAAAVAFGASMIPALTRLATDCTVPLCRDLGPARDLAHHLASAAFDVALLAWLAEMFTQPAAAARATVDVVDPLISGTIAGLRDLLRIV